LVPTRQQLKKLRAFRHDPSPGEGAGSVKTSQAEDAVSTERSGQGPVNHLCGKLTGDRSVPDPIREVEQYIAEHDPAIIGVLPCANCRRVVPPVDTREGTALGEGVGRVERGLDRLSYVDRDVPTAFDPVAIVRLGEGLCRRGSNYGCDQEGNYKQW
jgi:hypothetical protein